MFVAGTSGCRDDPTMTADATTGGAGTSGGTASDHDTTSPMPPSDGDDTSGSTGAVDSTGSSTAGSDDTASSDGTGLQTTGEGSSSEGTSGDPTSTGADPVCGDGIVHAGEECDDTGESASCDADCTLAACGDGVVNAAAGESCDGDDLADASCETLGWVVGTLGCDAGCGYDTALCSNAPLPPELTLAFAPIKRFEFAWTAVPDADSYELLERATPGDPWLPIATDLLGESLSLEMPLHLRHQASYVLRACNEEGCSDSLPVDVLGNLATAVGYGKASNTEMDDRFGISAALSADGDTLAVGAYFEDGDDNGASGSGAVYVYVRESPGVWVQEAYVKASNAGVGDFFGLSVALAADGDTLAVGARWEGSAATGVGGDQNDESADGSGAAYVFVRDAAGTWTQQAYLKASNTGGLDEFGARLAISDDGDTLIVGARYEDSDATGIDGDGSNDLSEDSGAAYVFARDDAGAWAQEAYLKASDTEAEDSFGESVDISADGATIAVGATLADTGIVDDGGAVYLFVRDGAGSWIQQARLTAAAPGFEDEFGASVALSGDGSVLAVGAASENGSATGIDGDASDNDALNAGAAYVFLRDDLGTWTQDTYIKASNTVYNNYFGRRLTMNLAGTVLAVGAHYEHGDSIGVGGDDTNEGANNAGAVWVFVRDATGAWAQRAYVKASNTDAGDLFGTSVALDGAGTTLAVGATEESSGAIGIGGDQADDAAENAGAVYLY
jgi:hypothetical protein